MLAKCANPLCCCTFKRLREGKLIRVDKSSAIDLHPGGGHKSPGSARLTEYYWLCGPCSATFNLAFDRNHGIILIPLAGAGRHPPETPSGNVPPDRT